MDMSPSMMGALSLVLCAFTHTAKADELPSRAEIAPSAPELPLEDERNAAELAERDAQRYRIDLGIGLPANLAGGSAGGQGSLGALGGLSVPYGSASFEVRLHGPVWFLVQADGAFSTFDSGGEFGSSWTIGPSLGVRIEAPVFDFVSVGGYGVAFGSFARNNYGRATGFGGVEGGSTESFDIGGAFGASLHFRPTSFFGVRLGLELLRIGFRRVQDSWTDSVQSSAFGELKASPRIALTFSF